MITSKICNGTSVKRKLQYGEAREVSIAQNKTCVYVKRTNESHPSHVTVRFSFLLVNNFVGKKVKHMNIISIERVVGSRISYQYTYLFSLWGEFQYTINS